MTKKRTWLKNYEAKHLGFNIKPNFKGRSTAQYYVNEKQREEIKCEIVTAMYKHGGIIKKVAAELGMSRTTIYEYMDEFDEVREAQERADDRLDRHVVETAYDKLDQFMAQEEDNTLAFKAVDLALRRSRKSRYYTEPVAKGDVNVNVTGKSDAEIAAEIQATNAK